MHLYFAPQKNLFDAPYVGVILRAEPSMDMHDLYTEHSCGYIWIQVGATIHMWDQLWIEHMWKTARRAEYTELAGQCKEPGTQTEFTLMWGSSIVIFKKH